VSARHVAFFRNLNLGQSGSPTRAQLLEAFKDAGAVEVASFQVNGTVAFTSTSPARTGDRARAWLVRHTDWNDVAPVRSRAWLVDLAARLNEVEGNAEVAFFDLRRDFPKPLPWRPATGRLTVVAADRRHAIAVNDEERRSFATPTLERLLGVPVTSRGAGTVLRLAERLR
jgi:uncharacterized protein (DUF1697 family)